jgi:hypothetical protein
MGDIVSYCEQVAQLLEKKRAHIEQQGIKKLGDSFHTLQTYYENIFNIFINKAFIKEDPYKYDEKLSEVETPSDDVFTDSDEQEKLNQRMSQYHTRLEFLNNYYEYSIEFLDLSRIKRIVRFLKYFNWSLITETSTSPTTRAMAKYLLKIRHGSDALSTNIINDSIGQLEKTVKTAFIALSDLIAFQKERYKLDLRRRLIPRLALTGIIDESKIEPLISRVKQLFSSSVGPNVPFFPDLVKETLSEDYTDAGEELKKQILESLHVEEEKKKEKKKEDIYRAALTLAIRYLSTCNLQLEDALKKTVESQEIIENQEISIGRRFNRWLRKVLGKGEVNRVYEIEYFNVATSSNKTEKVVFQELMETTKKMIQLFAGVSNKMSPIYHKVENSPEDRLFNLLNQNLINLQLVYRRLNGLINVFKAEIPSDKKARIKGISLELNAIKSSLVKANQKKHEYVALKEEEEQMKRLGLKKENN